MKQQRNTRQRQLVLDAVRARCGQSGCDHPTAEQVYLDVRAVDGRVSRGTVYRNLNFLAQHGRLLHVAAPQADRFDSRLDLHYHLLCTECGALHDVPLAYRAELDRTVAEESGYAIERHCTVFEGLCPICREERT